MRSKKAEGSRNTAIATITDKLDVHELASIFPESIRPVGPIGDNALFNLRSIVNKVPNLAALRTLFTKECVNAHGHPVSFSYTHSVNILRTLRENEVSTHCFYHLDSDGH